MQVPPRRIALSMAAASALRWVGADRWRLSFPSAALSLAPMSTLYDPDRRYRRRVLASLTRLVIFVAGVSTAAVVAYRYGGDVYRDDIERLEQALAEAQRETADLEQTAIRAEAAARAATTQFEDLRERFEREVPTGERKEITDFVIAQMAEGLDRERLMFAIRAAATPQDCTEAETRRFIMPTPAYQGPNTAVGFADGRITVSGMGENAVADNGGILGWFDPAQPVTVTLTLIGGETHTVSGRLPLHYSIPLDGVEWRFTVTEGDQSFANVTADRCTLATPEDGETTSN